MEGAPGPPSRIRLQDPEEELQRWLEDDRKSLLPEESSDLVFAKNLAGNAAGARRGTGGGGGDGVVNHTLSKTDDVIRSASPVTALHGRY